MARGALYLTLLLAVLFMAGSQATEHHDEPASHDSDHDSTTLADSTTMKSKPGPHHADGKEDDKEGAVPESEPEPAADEEDKKEMMGKVHEEKEAHHARRRRSSGMANFDKKAGASADDHDTDNNNKTMSRHDAKTSGAAHNSLYSWTMATLMSASLLVLLK